MPKKLIQEPYKRNPIAHVGEFEPGDGDMMMKRTRRNYAPWERHSPSRKEDENHKLLRLLFEKEMATLYGKKYPDRKTEASMYDILSGGLEARVEGDYIKGYFQRGDHQYAKKLILTGQVQVPDQPPVPKQKIRLADLVKKDIVFRINKSKSQYVSENHDNYRQYAYDRQMDQFIYDHFFNPERTKGKTPPEIEDWFTTVYKKEYIDRMRNLAHMHGYELDESSFEQHDENDQNAANRNNEGDHNVKRSKSKAAYKSGYNTLDSTKKGKNDKKRDQSMPKLKDMSWKERVLKRSDDEKRKERIDDLHKWARWLPDSAYQSYFGRPAFHCYGRDNTVPSYGGHVYGDYMLTHNVNPEHGENMPKYQQVYRAAMSKGFAHGDRVPVLSRQRRENLEIPDSVLKEMMKRNPIMPKTYVEPPNTDEYTDGSDNEWDFSQLEKKNKNRNKIDFHPKKKQSKEEIKDGEQDVKSDQEDDGKENKENEIFDSKDQRNRDEFDQNDIDQEGNQPGYTYERAPRGSIPQPGTLEYKRMLEQFLRNPEK